MIAYGVPFFRPISGHFRQRRPIPPPLAPSPTTIATTPPPYATISSLHTTFHAQICTHNAGRDSQSAPNNLLFIVACCCNLFLQARRFATNLKFDVPPTCLPYVHRLCPRRKPPPSLQQLLNLQPCSMPSQQQILHFKFLNSKFYQLFSDLLHFSYYFCNYYIL